jgi:arginyl-tRNA synthetase
MIPRLLHPVLQAAATTIAPEAEADPLIATGNPQHGDYQWNFAFRMAKFLKTNPRALAEKLLPLLTHPAIASASVAGPGFLNLKLSDTWLSQQLSDQAADPALGVDQEGAGKTVVIDFSSPNVAKRMHIGHMRSTHIGHALYRMHKASGWKVIGDNHIGDWGTQFGKLIVAWNRWLDEAAFKEDGIGELERLYVKFNQEEKEDPALIEQARAETVKLQQGEPGNTALWKRFMEISLEEFEKLYQRMGVSFDVVLGESAYKDDTPGVVSGLLKDGVAEHSEGAVIVRFEEPSLKEHPMIVQKRDGAANYATSDLACIRYRLKHWNPAKMLYVTDMRQQLHFQQVFAVAKRWGVASDLQHCWFGMLVLPEGVMGNRKGNVIRLIDLLDEAVRRARSVVDTKNPDLPEEERATIAEVVGVDSVRYADLSQNPQTNVTFEWDRMLSLEGNTAPYLLYSHARCVQVLAKAGEAVDLSAIQLVDPLERELALALLRLPEAVAGALRNLRPNLLGDALFGVANAFNRFYHDLPVLKGGEYRASRLALVEASRRVLRGGMELLGLNVLDRM